jgi:hypothetical protein
MAENSKNPAVIQRRQDEIGDTIDFKRIKEISCWDGATEIQLIHDRIFVSGYKADENSHLWIDKNRDILYSLSSSTDKSGEHYFILKYAIHE